MTASADPNPPLTPSPATAPLAPSAPRLSAERSAALHRAALSALLREHFGRDGLTVDTVGAGAGAVQGDTAWLLLAGAGERALGHALGWSVRAGASVLHLVVAPDEAALNTRRAAGLDPRPTVWAQQGRTVEQVEPLPAPDLPHPADALAALGPAIAELGASVIVEDGIVFGEVRGLEVARVLTADDGTPELRVGVGVFDQEAFAALADGADPRVGLARLIAEVHERRRAGALIHPMNRLARERWLRSVVLDDPALAGAERLVPVAPLIGRRGIHERQPAAALGIGADGGSVLVVCTVGVDLDVVPTAAELSRHHGADSVVVVVPPRDRHRLIDELAGRLAVPARVEAIEPPWDPDLASTSRQ
ncbi:MAG: hypothetical protein KDB21_17205 [Acidimicrobiales bacterium]|nr:hypothetical protein [Acidimicrobiales bacterium]